MDQGINSYFTHGIGPLVVILNNLIYFEVSVTTFPSEKIVHGNGKLVLQGSRLNLTQTCKYLNLALRILAFGNAVCLQKRQTLLKGLLDSKFHYLIKPSNPVTDELLGPNLEQQISEGNRVMEAAKKLAITRRPYFKHTVKRDKSCFTQFNKKSRNTYNSPSRKYYSSSGRRY